MSLLELRDISKRYEHGTHAVDALRDVSLELDRGELVAVWGLRRSGRSTLLRLAAGIEAPTNGVVRFAGEDLASGVLADGIAYCRPAPGAPHGREPQRGHVVLEEVSTAALARGATPSQAKALAQTALARTGTQHCAQRATGELNGAESVRVKIAQALAAQPLLLLIDEPTKGIDLLERDAILELLRTVANDGVAVLATVSESTGLSGADRALTLSHRGLHGAKAPQLAPLVSLPRRAIA